MFKALRGKRSLILVLLAVLGCMFIALPALAGEGDGTGGGKDIPLALDSSNPANGLNNVSVTTDINLTFNKNVVNLTVKENNMKCFSLTANGSVVPVQVIMPDDQVDFEHRRNIDIQPLQDLKPGTTYKLVISGQLQAKNGMSLGSPVTVSFTTAASDSADQSANVGQDNQDNQDSQSQKNDDAVKASSDESNPSSSSAEEVKTDTTTKKNVQTASKESEQPDSELTTKAEKETKTVNTPGIAAAAGLVLIAAGVYGYYRYSIYSRKK